MKDDRDAKYWIETLGLEPHPEGGYFRQTYKSDLKVTPWALLSSLPPGTIPTIGRPRAASTAIYFLLNGETFSAFHRLKSDEMWHFYTGSPLMVHVIDPTGKYSSILMGSDPEAGQVFQAVVPAGCWFASHVADWIGCALTGCTVAPGFEFEDFEIGKRDELVREFPKHREIIQRLTRG
jgi:uncharacterized protein